MPGLQQQLGSLWVPLMALALQGARSSEGKSAVRSLCHVRLRPIPDAELARIPVPTTLVWGRHDRQTPRVAQRASERFGWPLHVIEDAADDPAFEKPAAVLER